MRKIGKPGILIILCLLAVSSFSQTVWSEVKAAKSSVFVGEPVEVKITVYTSTWFTRGIDPGNIKVEGAFSVFFRPTSKSFQKNGKTFAGVELIYNVFPYSEKDLVFPELDIRIESPPEGDYKGREQVLRTKELRIRVKPVPPGFDDGQWLVTSGFKVEDSWQADLNNVKVGDVLVRRIRRSVAGTVSELIPPILWDTIIGASMYQARSSVDNQNTKTEINGSRTETMRYLIEKEGEVTIPEMVFSWYNPIQKKLFKRTLKAVKLNVQPNPDLGVLTSIRDSLAIQQEQMRMESDEDLPFRIFGFSPLQFTGFLVFLLILFYSLYYSLKKIILMMRIRRESYRNSEAWYFDVFRKSLKNGNHKETINALYRWIDELQLAEPGLSYFATTYGTRDLKDEVAKINKALQSNSRIDDINIKLWQQARNNFKNGSSVNLSRKQAIWINPVS